MELTLRTPAAPTASAIDDLRAHGICDEDIRLAVDFQDVQRRAGVPVFPLRVICGLDTPQRRSGQLGTTPVFTKNPTRRPGKRALDITRSRVWANSVQTGSTAEAEFAVPLTQRLRGRLVIAGKRALKLGRKLACAARGGERALTANERKLISYSPSCQQILVELLDNEKFRKGWCIPTYETIARWTGLSRSTIYRSLRVLADIGLIEWIRRFDCTRDSVVGARSTQTSNLYRFCLPTWLETLVGLQPPGPADDAHRREQATADHAEMLATWSPAAQGKCTPAMVADVGCRLAQRLGYKHQARECHDGHPPLREDSIDNKQTSDKPPGGASPTA